MATAYCSECGAKLLEGARFCPKCRHPVTEQSQPQIENLPRSGGSCVKCGAALLEGARFCPKCRFAVGQAAPNVQQTANVKQAANVQQAAGVQQAAVQAFSRLAPSQGGEIALDMPNPMGAVTQAVGRRFGIANILAGLGAGGLSGAALWNTEHPMIISVCISAGAVVLRIIIGLIRRRRR